jgi:Histidine kinase-, DNA gyrase B-, and HSP90-like ATPase
LRLDTCSFSIQLGDLSLIVEALVDNAFKFSRHETPVSLELSAGGRLIITDRGQCMSAEEIRRLGAFQQFDHQKYEQQGLGLGLVLVQKLVARCHGEFSLSSAPGERTQAQIDFPLAETGSKKTCSTASARSDVCAGLTSFHANRVSPEFWAEFDRCRFSFDWLHFKRLDYLSPWKRGTNNEKLNLIVGSQLLHFLDIRKLPHLLKERLGRGVGAEHQLESSSHIPL